MDTDSIPLYDGEPSGAKIIHETHRSESFDGPASTESAETAGPLRHKRRTPRKDCSHIQVCFSPCDPSGRVEHVACPVFNISRGGFALEFDRALDVGVTGHISYLTAGHRPVRVSCSVRHCLAIGGGRYRLGISLDRYLDHEERRPAKKISGRDVAPSVRTRSLRARTC
ncbi:MAG: PilZ domain-containing protein [Phycisphaerae bacterium]